MHWNEEEGLRNRIRYELRRLRRERRYTQEQLAGLLHVSKSTVSDYECGTIPDVYVLMDYCRIFHTDLNTITGLFPSQLRRYLSEEEYELIRKYRASPDWVREMIDTVTDCCSGRQCAPCHDRIEAYERN